jgi:hypothetical protein
MIMFQMLLGHLVGDYLLQNEWMAMNKSKNNMKGTIAAMVHCLLYTFAVCLFMWNFQLIWIIVVFLSHFPIDKFALGEKYMHYLKGKGLKDYVVRYSQNKIPNGYDALEGGFSAVVYTITDNTMHLVLMFIAYKLIY